MHRILLADDEAQVRLLVRDTLDDDNVELIQAENGVAALAAAKASNPSLIVMDWMMPGMTGIEVLRALKQDPSTRAIPVILLTGRGEQNDRKVCLEAGASVFLTKPFDPRDLIDSVERLLPPET
jgi:CheY-like chemotaxis protein